jgi:hypothetical protein
VRRRLDVEYVYGTVMEVEIELWPATTKNKLWLVEDTPQLVQVGSTHTIEDWEIHFVSWAEVEGALMAGV